MRNEFLKRIQDKVVAEKEAMKERLDDMAPSLLAKFLKPSAGVLLIQQET